MKRPLHALIVEDSESDARRIVHELRRDDFDVTFERVEGPDTLKAALNRRTWDVVVCEYLLAHFPSASALNLIKAWNPDVPVIYVSGIVGEERAVEALKAGAHDFVLKRGLARLGLAVERALREAQCQRDRRRTEAEGQRVLAELQAAMAEVRRLSGQLPMCPKCKRVLDDHGLW